MSPRVGASFVSLAGKPWCVLLGDGRCPFPGGVGPLVSVWPWRFEVDTVSFGVRPHLRGALAGGGWEWRSAGGGGYSWQMPALDLGVAGHRACRSGCGGGGGSPLGSFEALRMRGPVPKRVSVIVPDNPGRRPRSRRALGVCRTLARNRRTYPARPDHPRYMRCDGLQETRVLSLGGYATGSWPGRSEGRWMP